MLQVTIYNKVEVEGCSNTFTLLKVVLGLGENPATTNAFKSTLATILDDESKLPKQTVVLAKRLQSKLTCWHNRQCKQEKSSCYSN